MYPIDTRQPVSQRMAYSVMNRYTPAQVKWHYEHGLVLQSIYAVGKHTGNPQYCSWVKAMYDTIVSADGTIRGYREAEYNLDQINPGKTLFSLYRDFGEDRYRTGIETLRNQLRIQPRTKAGGFWHKQIYPSQMWLDGLYMQGPFYAQYGGEYGSPEDFEDVAAQLILMESKARDEKTGLLYHAWDEDRTQAWANPDTGCSPHFWGRAMGWYAMALVDVLDFVPPEQDQTVVMLRAIATRLAQAIIEVQDPQSGMWYQVVDQGGVGQNYLESSASSMFVYFLLKLIRTGVLNQAAIPAAKEAALKAYQGIMEKMVQEDPSGELHLGGICAVAGLGGHPYRDGSFAYYVGEPVVGDDFKGIGPFILASLEREGLESCTDS
ncbi:MAG: glycoside hydrolase family 88 protein [Treponema sp.]|jgi:unsaturated rhamnogalacturonyl hydrolase|nr:glycoside hydrolase family 88 protein [Treponema sp.]